MTNESCLASKLDWPFLRRAGRPLSQTRGVPGPQPLEDHIAPFDCMSPWPAMLPTWIQPTTAPLALRPRPCAHVHGVLRDCATTEREGSV